MTKLETSAKTALVGLSALTAPAALPAANADIAANTTRETHSIENDRPLLAGNLPAFDQVAFLQETKVKAATTSGKIEGLKVGDEIVIRHADGTKENHKIEQPSSFTGGPATYLVETTNGSKGFIGTIIQESAGAPITFTPRGNFEGAVWKVGDPEPSENLKKEVPKASPSTPEAKKPEQKKAPEQKFATKLEGLKVGDTVTFKKSNGDSKTHVVEKPQSNNYGLPGWGRFLQNAQGLFTLTPESGVLVTKPDGGSARGGQVDNRPEREAPGARKHDGGSERPEVARNKITIEAGPHEPASSILKKLSKIEAMIADDRTKNYIVHITAPEICGPCRQNEPSIHAAKAQFNTKEVVWIDVVLKSFDQLEGLTGNGIPALRVVTQGRGGNPRAARAEDFMDRLEAYPGKGFVGREDVPAFIGNVLGSHSVSKRGNFR